MIDYIQYNFGDTNLRFNEIHSYRLQNNTRDNTTIDCRLSHYNVA